MKAAAEAVQTTEKGREIAYRVRTRRLSGKSLMGLNYSGKKADRKRVIRVSDLGKKRLAWPEVGLNSGGPRRSRCG